MHRFEVWAPLANSMSVKVDDADYPMKRVGEGSWRADIDSAGPGSDYGFLIDAEETVYPDPRSSWQPHGVHGLSRIYDQSTFAWADHGFQAPPLASAVIYELHVGTFTPDGTLDSAIERLDYLWNLGITHVELMPMASFAGSYGWGYDGVSLFAVHEPYGGPEALKRFVNAGHKRGLGILLDVVYNHFGPVGNYTGKFGPYLTQSHKTPWGGAVNLEESGSHQVRRFFCDNAMMWMRDFHIDGLRIDAVHSFVDRSAIHFLEQLARETDTLSATVARNLVLIAESDLNDPSIVSSRDCGGYGIDAQWNDDFHHALATILAQEEPAGYFIDFGSLERLAKAITDTFVYDGTFSRYRNRIHGRSARNLSQHRFIGFIQNHDQVGNRAIGDRFVQMVGHHRAKIASALVLLAPFVPLIFQGEEWAASSPFLYFASHEDPELAKQVAEGRRREFAAFGWDPASIPDPGKTETFLRSKLPWAEMSKVPHAEFLAWYRNLIRIRRSAPCLNNGEPGNAIVTFSEDQRWFCMQRGSILVSFNLATGEQTLAVDSGCALILSSRPDIRLNDRSLTLPPDSVAILENDGRC
jgi:maltooligosyltrehalose trehalohydrolase